MTLDTIARSLLPIFVRIEKLDASLGALSRPITDLENLSRGIGQARQHTVYGARGQLLTGSCIPVFHIHVAPGEPPPAHPRFVTLRLVQHRYADDHPERASPR